MSLKGSKEGKERKRRDRARILRALIAHGKSDGRSKPTPERGDTAKGEPEHSVEKCRAVPERHMCVERRRFESANMEKENCRSAEEDGRLEACTCERHGLSST